MIFLFRGWIAQSVEQQTENLRVGSSILPLTTISFLKISKIFSKIIINLNKVKIMSRIFITGDTHGGWRGFEGEMK